MTVGNREDDLMPLASGPRHAAAAARPVIATAASRAAPDDSAPREPREPQRPRSWWTSTASWLGPFERYGVRGAFLLTLVGTGWRRERRQHQPDVVGRPRGRRLDPGGGVTRVPSRSMDVAAMSGQP
jgi:hypothetical protein